MLRYSSLFTILLVMFAFVGCDSATSTEDDEATFSLLLTDAPGDFERAVVTIESIYLQPSEEDSNRVLLRDEPATVDLLTLQNEVMDLVENEVVPEGIYEQLRIVISGGFIEVEQEDGTTMIYASSSQYASDQGEQADGRLQMPSFAQSGLKISLPEDAGVVEGGQNIVLIDFDVADSFGKQAGQSGKWVMRPSIKATDLQVTGSASVDIALADTVTLPSDTLSLADFSAALDKGGDVIEVPFADADGDGVYSAEFIYLAPGSYPVNIVSPDSVTVTTDPVLPIEISVESNGTAEAALTITEASKVESGN